jgi:hypothetical protein
MAPECCPAVLSKKKKEEREECLRSFAGLEKSKSKLPRREERHLYFKI